jgi:hypothetical protein
VALADVDRGVVRRAFEDDALTDGACRLGVGGAAPEERADQQRGPGNVGLALAGGGETGKFMMK